MEKAKPVESGGNDTELSISSMVSGRTGEPLICLEWGTMKGTLTPEQSIEHALHVLEVATGSWADAFLMKFLQQKVGAELSQAVGVLRDFRAFREDRVLTNVIQRYEEEDKPDCLD